MTLVLQQRDWDLFHHIKRVDVVNTTLAAALCFHDGYDYLKLNTQRNAKPMGNWDTARKRLYRLQRDNYLDLEHMPPLPPGERQLWRLTRKTLEMLEPEEGIELPKRMSPGNTKHHLAAVEIYVNTVNALRGYGLADEFCEDLDWKSERRTARYYRKPDGTTGKIIPDATLEFGGLFCFVERQRREAKKTAEYLAGRVAAYAQYLAQSDRRLQQARVLFAVDKPQDVQTMMQTRQQYPHLNLLAASPERIVGYLVDTASKTLGEVGDPLPD